MKILLLLSPQLQVLFFNYFKSLALGAKLDSGCVWMHIWLLPDLRGKVFIFLPLSLMFSLGFLQILIRPKKFPPSLSLFPKFSSVIISVTFYQVHFLLLLRYFSTLMLAFVYYAFIYSFTFMLSQSSCLMHFFQATCKDFLIKYMNFFFHYN